MKKRKKEWIACMLSVVMALSSFNSVVFAQENENANTIQPSSDQNPAMYPLSTMAASVETTFEADGINYCVTGNDPNTVSVIPLDKAEYEGKVDIPETVQYDGIDYTVTSIGAEAFGESTLVTAIVIPDTVTSIGINAFGGCTALQSLYISGNVTDGLGGAMTGLWGRDYTISYEVPDWPNVKVTFGEGSPYEIDGGVLYNGTVAEAALDYHAKTIRIREGTTEIADVAFNFPFNEGSYYYNQIEKRETETVLLPSSVKTIGEMAFKNCPLKSINLENVEIIEQGAFIRTKLTEADLTNTTRIDYQAFSGCNLLADVVWPKNLEELRTGEPGEIGSDPTASKAFENCTSLRNVVISGSITDIPDEAFIGCTSLESIILPEGLTSIGDSAFALLNSQGANPNPQLKSINIPSTVTSLGDHFLGGLKADGETLLISQVTDPSIFTEDALAGISGDGVNAPTIYYPTEAKEAYTAESSPLKDMLPLDEATEGKQDYMLKLPESAQVKVDESLALAVAANLPEGATVNYSSGDSKIATVDNGTITGVAAGSTTITASISLNGVVLATDECMVTVTADVIYLDGTSGNDNNSGADTNNAVKTLEKALKMVANDGTIYVCGTVTVDGSLTVEGAKIARADGFDGTLISVDGADAALTLKNTTIDGKNQTVDYGSYLVFVTNGGTLTIEDGTDICNNKTTAVYVNNNGYLNMTGGSIRNNTITNPINGMYYGGAGIYNAGISDISGGEISGNIVENYTGGGISNQRGTVTLRGNAVIKDNQAAYGGGISMVAGAKTILDGASITGNKATTDKGGGVYIFGYSDDPAVFEMRSGSITQNTSASSYGAAINAYSQNSGNVTVNISGGIIKDNVSGSGSGYDIYLVNQTGAEGGYPTLNLSGSPEISGGVYAFNNSAININVVDAFAPVNPIELTLYNTQPGELVVDYADGVTPNVGHFTAKDSDIALVQKDGNLVWAKAYTVSFVDEDAAAIGQLKVAEDNRIEAAQVPSITKTGYTLAGWYTEGAAEPWDFESDTVQADTTLYARWMLNAPEVAVTANVENPHEGTNAILTATPSHDLSNLTYTYQWYKDDTPLSGETGNQLTVSKTGKYWVKVTATDGNKTSAEAESEAVEITVDAHIYVPVVTKPTCTEQGYTTHICEICGDSYVDSYTEPIGHSFAAAWSHDANGHWKECERCGIKVDAAAHTFQWVTDKEATASETGSKHEECVVCGYKKAALEIPATGTSEDPSEPSKDAIHSPQTGDDNNLALWIAVLVTTGAALIGTTLYNRKRKYNR